MARTVLGGFSQGAVMSYALGLGAGRPRPAAIIALSGFIPTVEGFELDLERAAPAARHRPRHVRPGHRRRVRAATPARGSSEAGADVLYRESPMQHAIDPRLVAELRPWLGTR